MLSIGPPPKVVCLFVCLFICFASSWPDNRPDVLFSVSLGIHFIMLIIATAWYVVLFPKDI